MLKFQQCRHFSCFIFILRIICYMGLRMVLRFAIFPRTSSGLISIPAPKPRIYGNSTHLNQFKSGMFPPQTSMWGRWSPNKERTVLMGVSNAIAYLGNLASNILTGFYFESLLLTYFTSSYNLWKTWLAMGLLYLWYHWNYLGDRLDSVFQKFTSRDALDRSERTSIHWVGFRLGFSETLF